MWAGQHRADSPCRAPAANVTRIRWVWPFYFQKFFWLGGESAPSRWPEASPSATHGRCSQIHGRCPTGLYTPLATRRQTKCTVFCCSSRLRSPRMVLLPSAWTIKESCRSSPSVSTLALRSTLSHMHLPSIVGLVFDCWIWSRLQRRRPRGRALRCAHRLLRIAQLSSCGHHGPAADGRSSILF